MINLFETLASLESNDELHIGRLLILIYAFAGKKGDKRIEGLTKLAKLDFLLRYPVYLERALTAKNKSIKNINVLDHERKSVESSMVRYRYGPWDFRYRRFLNLLIAKGLVAINIKGVTIEIGLTPKGFQTVKTLAGSEPFIDLVNRSKILKSHFDYKGTHLMRFIYETFPEITTLKIGEEIDS